MTDLDILLWGKTGEQDGCVHPLLFHQLDAGCVASALWSAALPAPFKLDLARMLDLDIEAAGRLIAFWTALHDLGKASPAFQKKYAPALPALLQGGLPFPARAGFERPHGLVTGWSLSSEHLLSNLNPEESEALGRALSGHHGEWPDSDTFNDLARRDNLGGPAWQARRKSLCHKLTTVFDPPSQFRFPAEGQTRNLFLTLLSGLVSVADWLASNQSAFPPAGNARDWQDYRLESDFRAHRTLQEQGWLLWNDPNAGLPFRFEQVFPRLSAPRPVQSAVFDLAYEVPLPALALIEAPTGIGKTEIAFLLADRWLARSGGRGMYVAMPTQATSNQMYDRAKDFLSRRFPDQPVHVQLAHGHALLQDEFEQTVLRDIGEDTQSGVVAAGWFLPRKRTLLAPYGIGTVDQVFLSILQTRHFFVRLFGLYGKVIVFDEVHAYDAYQSELFVRLLGWLRALQVSVILLSATLPAHVRAKFVAAYGGQQPYPPVAGYPRLSLAGPAGISLTALPPSPSRAVTLTHLGKDPAELVAFLRDKLAGGGCAAIICNTVARAQAVFRAVREAGLAPQETILFHARFPFVWRKALEDRVLSSFGPGQNRPHCAVVVATQVIEQSLDLDFDVLISELAPIDLLIQRAGRLHRHQRDHRPPGLSTPCLAWMEPERTRQGDPDFGPDTYVYREYHLLKTHAILAERASLSLPEETPALIEAVYGEQEPLLEARAAGLLALARLDMQERMLASSRHALRRLVLPVEHEDLLVRRSEDLAEDDASLHTDFQALTREAPPGVNLVCLHRLADGRLALEPDDPRQVVEIGHEPDFSTLKQLLLRVVQVQRPDIVRYFAARPPHPAWAKVAALRGHHPLFFENGLAHLDGLGLAINLEHDTGLSFQKEVL